MPTERAPTERAPTERARHADVAFERGGVGPTVVWGHGLTSSRVADDASALIDWSRLAERVDLVRYDAIGHGDAELVTDLGRYHWGQLALDQLALHAALDLDSVVVGGASMGAATALHLAVLSATRPELVTAELRGLVLMIPPTAWESRAGQTEIYQRMAAIAEDEGVEAVLRARAAIPPPDPLVGDEVYRASRDSAMFALGAKRLSTVFRGAADTDLPSPSDVGAIAVPTLILAWTGDAGHPISTAERLHDLIDGSTLRVATTRADVANWTEEIAAFVTQ